MNYQELMTIVQGADLSTLDSVWKKTVEKVGG